MKIPRYLEKYFYYSWFFLLNFIFTTVKYSHLLWISLNTVNTAITDKILINNVLNTFKYFSMIAYIDYLKQCGFSPPQFQSHLLKLKHIISI